MSISPVSGGNAPNESGANAALWKELQQALAAFLKDPGNRALLQKVLSIDAELQKHCSPQQMSTLESIYRAAQLVNVWINDTEPLSGIATGIMPLQEMLNYLKNAVNNMITPNTAG